MEDGLIAMQIKRELAFKTSESAHRELVLNCSICIYFLLFLAEKHLIKSLFQHPEM